jgi:hypothetical protein
LRSTAEREEVKMSSSQSHQSIGKPLASITAEEARPADGVESLGEVELEDDRGSFAAIASLDQLRRDEILRDAPPGEETRLIDVDESANLLLQTKGQSLAQRLDGAILQRNGAEGGGGDHGRRLGEEDDV